MEPYSPQPDQADLDAQHLPQSPAHRDSQPPQHPQGGHPHQGSPPLVPVPHPSSSSSSSHPPATPDHHNDVVHQAYAQRAASVATSSASAYDDRASPAGYYPPRHDDPYRAHPHGAYPPAPPPHHHHHHHAAAAAAAGYRDPYAPAAAAYPPPPPHYPTRGPPPPPGYGAAYPPPPPHARDPYGPPRDPYGRSAYGAYPPPRDPYGAPPPPPAADYYGRPAPPSAHDYYARPPPPPVGPSPVPAAAAAAAYGPPPSTRSSAEPLAPTFGGAPPDPNDLSIPLLYLARSVSAKSFAPLRTQFHHLELRFINSLLELAADLHAVSLEHPNLLAGRRRVWVTAVGGTDALVARVRATTEAVLDWREVGDLATLERELALEERRVVTVRDEAAERQRRAERDEAERREREREDLERDRGRREIEERERDRAMAAHEAAQRELVGNSEPDELNEVLRAVRGESSAGTTAAPAAGGDANGHEHEHAHPHGDDAADGSRPPPGSGTTPQSPGRSSRKRSRHDDPLDDPDEDKEQRRAERKKLEAVCKMPRKRCVDASLQQGVPVNDETRAADDEPQLGERHKGIWDLFGEPLDDISPQIQVLMARAMRDATYPPRLRLYDHPEALEQLEGAVPWFVTLLQTVKSRYELAAADPPAPLDPPLAGPLATAELNNDGA